MSIDDVIDYLAGLHGVLTLQPGPGDGSPEISWGDTFFYYAPDGEVPRAQPFATIVTKDYPDEPGSRLDQPDAFRLNIGVGVHQFHDIVGHEPQEIADDEVDASIRDALFPHPVYGRQAWLAVVNPAERTTSTVLELLRSAHDDARARQQRRAGTDEAHADPRT